MRWLQRTPVSELEISAVTIQELRFGTEIAPVGAKKAALEQWLEHFVIPGFAGRIVPVDAAVADLCGRLLAKTKMAGHTCELGDAFIAATAAVHGLTLATLNRKHFERLGVKMVTF